MSKLEECRLPEVYLPMDVHDRAQQMKHLEAHANKFTDYIPNAVVILRLLREHYRQFNIVVILNLNVGKCILLSG